MKWIIALVALALSPLALAAAEESLPTPYTADQIREASPEGLTVKYKATTPAGSALRQSVVVGSSAEGMVLTDQTVDEEGIAVGEPREVRAGWEELRRHALFPKARAERARHSRTTALGDLEGWLYTVRSEAEGQVDYFFFADRFPGSPVLFWRMVGAEETLRVEHVARSDA